MSKPEDISSDLTPAPGQTEAEAEAARKAAEAAAAHGPDNTEDISDQLNPKPDK